MPDEFSDLAQEIVGPALARMGFVLAGGDSASPYGKPEYNADRSDRS